MDALSALLILCAITCSTFQTFFKKLYSGACASGERTAAPVFSVLYGLVVGLIVLAVNGFSFSAGAVTWTFGLINGFVLFMFNLASVSAARRGPYALQSVMTLFGSVLISLLVSALYWGDSLSAAQLVGIVLMLVAVLLLNSGGLRQGGVKKGYYFWVLTLFFSNGIYGSIMDAQQRLCHRTQRNEMIAISFLCLALISLVYLLLREKRDTAAAFRIGRRAWLLALVSCLGATGAVYLKMVLLARVSVSVLYTIQNGGIMAALAVLTSLVLKEKLSRSGAAGIALAVVSIVLLGM